MIHPTLYKIDENDSIREWFLEIDGDQYRTHSGIQGGKVVVSKWKKATAKNVGKKNEISAEEQAALEVERKYVEQKKTGGYYDTIELAKEGFKTYFQPMLAEKYPERKSKIDIGSGVWSQPKLDGVRAAGAPGELKTREGELFVTPTKIMGLLDQLHEKHPSIVFDGELYNHEYRNSFEKIISLIRKTVNVKEEHIAEANAKVEYHVYDMYDRDRPELMFSERQAVLKAILTDFDPSIVLVKTSLVHSEDEIDSLYGEYLEDQYEGQMIRLDEPYEMKRSKTLLKRKEFEDAEFVIDFVEEGVGNWAGAVKVAHIFLEDGRKQKSGVAGDFDYLAGLLAEADSLVGTEVTIRFQGRTGDGKLRFPVAKVFWKGKRDA